MEKTKDIKFDKQHFGKSLKSMLSVDIKRMAVSPLPYIMLGICLVVPILILVMTTMMGGMTTLDPVTKEEIPMETFTNTWQAIGSVSGAEMGMDLTGMCNINMLYFFMSVFVCLFVSEDFRSGYAKNLFTVRAKKTDYVFSKTVVSIVCCVGMLVVYFIGAMIGGAIAGLPFSLPDGVGATGIVMCMLSKCLLTAVFVPIYLAVSVAAKQKAWLSILASMCVGMLLFMMIPMMTPLNATVMNVVLCLAGGGMFSVGLGAVSNVILKKTALV